MMAFRSQIQKFDARFGFVRKLRRSEGSLAILVVTIGGSLIGRKQVNKPLVDESWPSPVLRCINLRETDSSE